MVSGCLTASLLLSAFPLASVLAADVPTDCWVLDGSRRLGYRCDNTTTGHSTCCQPESICYSNGVCAQINANIQDYLRVGCTDKTWKDPACLDQCRPYANSSAAGIRFCGGSITSTNQYCCDAGGNGAGSFKCCQDPKSIFAINPIATVLAEMPRSQLTTTSSNSATSTSTSTPTTSGASSDSVIPTSASQTPSGLPPTSTPDPPGKSSSNAVAIGAGVAVPVAVIGLGLLGFFAWRHRRNHKHKQAAELTGGGGIARMPTYRDTGNPQEVEAGDVPVAAVQKKGYFAGRDYMTAPQEVPNGQPHEGAVVHEMDGTTGRT